MQFVRKNKEILIQIIVFSIMGISFHKIYFIYFVATLLLLLFSQKLSSKYIILLNQIIQIIGYSIKTLLFTILFVFILCPIALVKKKNLKRGYIERNRTSDKQSFEKMW